MYTSIPAKPVGVMKGAQSSFRRWTQLDAFAGWLRRATTVLHLKTENPCLSASAPCPRTLLKSASRELADPDADPRPHPAMESRVPGNAPPGGKHDVVEP